MPQPLPMPSRVSAVVLAIAIAIGMDPLLTLASGSPVAVDENGYMEYEAAGAWRGAPTELVQCETNDLLVPAHAEYIIEGELLPGERIAEGPHGEAGGFYGQNIPYPGFGQASGVWVSTLAILVISATLYVLFKRRDWL